jgi:hypothetical protein
LYEAAAIHCNQHVRLRSEVVSSHWSIALWVLLRDVRLKIGYEEMTYLMDAERDSFLSD